MPAPLPISPNTAAASSIGCFTSPNLLATSSANPRTTSEAGPKPAVSYDRLGKIRGPVNRVFEEHPATDCTAQREQLGTQARERTLDAADAGQGLLVVR
jgi:hypothetical protein